MKGTIWDSGDDSLLCTKGEEDDGEEHEKPRDETSGLAGTRQASFQCAIACSGDGIPQDNRKKSASALDDIPVDQADGVEGDEKEDHRTEPYGGV